MVPRGENRVHLLHLLYHDHDDGDDEDYEDDYDQHDAGNAEDDEDDHDDVMMSRRRTCGRESCFIDLFCPWQCITNKFAGHFQTKTN